MLLMNSTQASIYRFNGFHRRRENTAVANHVAISQSLQNDGVVFARFDNFNLIYRLTSGALHFWL